MSTQQPAINNVVQLPLPFEGFPYIPGKTKGWSYLLADSLAFKKDVCHGIRIQKPDQEKVPMWIRRLITSGQCSTIYVENLTLPASDKVLIQQLCDKYAVSLINLTVQAQNADVSCENVVMGPW
ncbi:hypothetical protein [Vibrio sp.]|uniref:hypothetical protein n=1 Tax=Vibrio sp. TaxID=678 RepID=UPI003D0A8C1B